MPLTIGIPKETAKGEMRVAATPESIKRLLTKYAGITVWVEKNAGEGSNFVDAEYKKVGAKIVDTKKAWGADITLKVTPPTTAEAGALKKASLLIGNLDPFASEKLFKSLAKAGVNAIAMEKIPRISRAQSMDTLSSQANIAGYKAVIEAANYLNQFFPLMMTSAGSSKPAKVIVLGAGVAGLQAIATAKRLGANVSSFDVRPEVKEQVESLGAKFIEIDLGESGSGEGGYAKELSASAKKKQQAALQEILQTADVVITTAQIPGRAAPELITTATVKGMALGSVIVDLAAGSGGNCKLSKADKVVEEHGVTIIGHTNYPSMMAKDASNFYARNLINLLDSLLKMEGDKTTLKFDMEDEVISSSLVVYEGEVK